jgi:hypothetical protein
MLGFEGDLAGRLRWTYRGYLCKFLSCLHGSELDIFQRHSGRTFLSCLHGSEPNKSAQKVSPSIFRCLLVAK